MSYTSVTWTDNELVTAAKLNLMAANEDYLNQQLPQFLIAGPSGNQTGSLYIEGGSHDVLSGNYDVQTEGKIIVARIPFKGRFKYSPIVTATYVGNNINYRQVTVMVHGLNGSKHPSTNGMTVHLAHNKESAAFNLSGGQFFVNYIALGIKA